MRQESENDWKRVPKPGAWEEFVKHVTHDDPYEKAELMAMHPDDRRVMYEHFLKARGLYKFQPNIVPDLNPRIAPDLNPRIIPDFDLHIVPHLKSDLLEEMWQLLENQHGGGADQQPSRLDNKQINACLTGKQLGETGSTLLNAGLKIRTPTASDMFGAANDVANCLDDAHLERIKKNLKSFGPFREYLCQSWGLKEYCPPNK